MPAMKFESYAGQQPTVPIKIFETSVSETVNFIFGMDAPRLFWIFSFNSKIAVGSGSGSPGMHGLIPESRINSTVLLRIWRLL